MKKPFFHEQFGWQIQLVIISILLIFYLSKVLKIKFGVLVQLQYFTRDHYIDNLISIQWGTLH